MAGQHHEEFGRGTGTGHESLARAEAGKVGNDPYWAVLLLYDDDSSGLANKIDQTVLPINTRSSEAAAEPNPKGNLKLKGEMLIEWRALYNAWRKQTLDTVQTQDQ